MATLKYVANSTLQTVTLGSNYIAGSGSMSLTAGHGARLPTSGDFWIAYNDGAGTIRIFKVTSRSADALSVVPDATEGSGDGNITSGSTLRWALTVAALTQLRADILADSTYVLLSSQTASASASLNFTSLPTDYNQFDIVIQDLLPSVDGTSLNLRVTTDGGATWVSTASYHWMSYRMGGGTVGPNGNSADTFMTFATIQGNTANSYSAQGTIRIYHPQSSNTYKSFGGLIYGAGAYPPSTNTIWVHNFFGNYNSTTPINGFQIIPGSGNLASGIVRLYGLKKS